MSRIFLDVGSHLGQSIDVALDPRFGFDRVIGFEPVSSCLARLNRLHDPRLTILPFGLGRTTGAAVVYEPGSDAGSLYAKGPTEGVPQETVEVRDVAEWFIASFESSDEVWMKLNCEGAEADIVERLHETGLLGRVSHLLLSLDIRWVPDQAHRAQRVLDLLETAKVDYTKREDLDYSVRRWLERWSRTPSMSDRFAYWTGRHLPPIARIRRVGRAVLGPKVADWIVAHTALRRQ